MKTDSVHYSNKINYNNLNSTTHLRSISSLSKYSDDDNDADFNSLRNNISEIYELTTKKEKNVRKKKKT
jgi:hypothetical protein